MPLIYQAGTLLKTATLGQGGKQIILQKQGGLGGPGQPQIVTLVKTSQGMQVATMPKGTLMQASGSPQTVKTVTAGGQILQTQAGKTIPQGATIVKLVNAQGGAVGPGGQKIMTTMKTIGGGATNVMTMSKPGGTLIHQASPQGMQGKPQTIVINKQGTMKNAQGQQIIVVSTAGGLKTVQTLSQAGGSIGHGNLIQTGSGQGVKMIVVSSGQLSQTTNRPIAISMPGGSMPKTVTLAHGSKMAISGGQQIYNTSTGQILTLPASNILGGQAGKPFTLQMAGGGQKTLTLVQAPNQTTSSPQVIVQSSSVTSGPAPTITTSHEGPVSSDAALAQLAAEAGLLEGGDGSMIQVNH